MTANPPIVVGVDGSRSSICAARWAAETAARHNAPLVLLSAVTIPVTAYDRIGLTQSFFDQQELEVTRRLDEAAGILHDAAGDGELSVSTELATIPPVPALIDRSKNARMVVCGSRGLGEVTGGVLGSVTSALTHHAHSPVAVIREWPRPTDPRAMGTVVVGVDGSAHSEPAIAVAFEEASLRGADLVVVHAWSGCGQPRPGRLRQHAARLHQHRPAAFGSVPANDCARPTRTQHLERMVVSE